MADHWQEWESKKYHWMSEEQKECYNMLCDICCGANHVFGIIRDAGPKGIYINALYCNYLATFDFDRLTRAVVMAHDRMIRFEISPSGPRMLQLSFHKRDKREGRMHEKHPTIEDAIKIVRKDF
jgi:hypothetical protein